MCGFACPFTRVSWEPARASQGVPLHKKLNFEFPVCIHERSILTGRLTLHDETNLC